MKSKKKLLKIYNEIKNKEDLTYYSFEDFVRGAKSYIKDVKKRNTICSIAVSRSGMTRKFNFKSHNAVLNICYHGKHSWDAVKVGGCGMDMHWHLKYRVCQMLMTKGEIAKGFINGACSSGSVL